MSDGMAFDERVFFTAPSKSSGALNVRSVGDKLSTIEKNDFHSIIKLIVLKVTE